MKTALVAAGLLLGSASAITVEYVRRDHIAQRF
jgi:hypothetical protein